MNFTDDIPKYKKKSQKKPPKKAKHKHLSEPCVIDVPRDWYKKEHERSGEMKSDIYGYCPICGKVTEFYPDRDRWLTHVRHYDGPFTYLETVPTEECARELNPETRTLPTFKSNDWPVKNVVLDISL